MNKEVFEAYTVQEIMLAKDLDTMIKRWERIAADPTTGDDKLTIDECGNEDIRFKAWHQERAELIRLTLNGTFIKVELG